jgi:transcriptional regulator with XRE-family HTH domain
VKYRSTLGPRIRAAREAQNLTQRDLAERSGCGHTAISECECGRMIPGPRRVRAIAEALGLDPEATASMARNDVAARAVAIWEQIQ